MTPNDDEVASPRRFPRTLAYPMLLGIAIAGIYGGIRLGSIESIASVALASQNHTPVENWTIFLLSLGIVLFMYVGHIHAHRTLRVSAASLVAALGSLAALLLFGAWGLCGVVAVRGFSFALHAWRRRSRVQPLVRNSER